MRLSETARPGCQGPATGFLVAADGARMDGVTLTYVLREQPGASAFRIEQYTVRHTSVSVVPAAGCPEDLERIVRDRFRQRLGELFSVSLLRL